MEAARGRRRARLLAPRARQKLGEALKAASADRNLQHRADEHPVLLAHECLATDPELEHPGTVALPARFIDRAAEELVPGLGGREGREVVGPGDCVRARVK